VPSIPTGGSSFTPMLALRRGQRALLPARTARRRRGVHRGHRFRVHRAEQHVRLAYTIDMAKLEDGVARLHRYLQS
jgi:hypothetical protein